MYWLVIIACSYREAENPGWYGNTVYAAHRIDFLLVGCSLPLFAILSWFGGLWLLSKEWGLALWEDYGFMLYSILIIILSVNILGMIMLIPSMCQIERSGLLEKIAD